MSDEKDDDERIPRSRSRLRRARAFFLLGGSPATTSVQLSALSAAENVSVGSLLATISTSNKPVDWGDSVYTVTADPDSKFVIDGVDNTRLELENAFNYEAASSHSVTITDTPTGPYSPIARAFTFSVTNVALANTVAPVVSGTPEEGETQSSTNGTWTDSTGVYTYQWYQAVLDGSNNVVTDMAGVPLLDNPIGGATSATYDATAGDVGERLFCAVTGTDGTNFVTAYSNATDLIEEVGYEGPGDVVSGAIAWWGLRAYSAATIGANAVRLIRASDSAEQDFITLADGSLDVASIATFLAATTGSVKTIYDQTGNGKHLAAVSDAVTQASMTLNGLGSLPCLTAAPTGAFKYSVSITQALPVTISVVNYWDTDVGGRNEFVNSNGTTIRLSYITNGGCGGGVSCLLMDDTAVGTQFGSQALVDVWHTSQNVYAGASTAQFTDGAAGATAGGDFTSGLSGTFSFWGPSFNGKFTEMGLWASAFNGTQATNMDANQSAYWGI